MPFCLEGNGCNFKTVIQQIHIASVPVVFVLQSKPGQCLFGNQFVLTNTTTNWQRGAMNYRVGLWEMEQCWIQRIHYVPAIKNAGTYKIKLVVNSISVCADSAEINIIVYQNATAAFTAAEPTCVNLPVSPVNNTLLILLGLSLCIT